MDGINRDRKKTYGDRVGRTVGAEWWPDTWKTPVLWKTKKGVKGVDDKDGKSSPRADHFKHGPSSRRDDDEPKSLYGKFLNHKNRL